MCSIPRRSCIVIASVQGILLIAAVFYTLHVFENSSPDEDRRTRAFVRSKFTGGEIGRHLHCKRITLTLVTVSGMEKLSKSNADRSCIALWSPCETASISYYHNGSGILNPK